MRVTHQQMINKLNAKLAEHGQLTRVVKYTGSLIVLSTGVSLTSNEKHKFCKRVLNKKTNLWAAQIDGLMSGKITEKSIRSELASAGGKAAQKIHGDKIMKNLNTGTAWNAGTKGQNIGRGKPRTQDTKDKISAKNSGKGNGMYGYSPTWDERLKKSKLMRAKILAGEFTPNSNNRNTHWEATYNGKKYRSSWEALYQFFNQSAQYETLRIEYELRGATKVYIVDFVDHRNKLVIEVKPRELCVGELFNSKITALTKWAKTNNYSVLIADKEWLASQTIDIDYTKFDHNTIRKIKKLYETNQKD